MPNGLSSISCKFIDRITLTMTALTELTSSLLCHIKVFLLPCSLLVLNLFKFLEGLAAAAQIFLV